MKRVLAVVLILCMAVLSACAANADKEAEKLEKEKGISYEKIVCQYTQKPENPGEYEDYAINYTVYADNRIEIWTGPCEEAELDVVYSGEHEITEEQKNELIKAIRENKLAETGSKTAIDEAKYLCFYDAEGKEVLFCSGDGETFSAVETVLCGMIPELRISEIKRLSALKTEEAITEKRIKEAESKAGISYNSIVCQLEVSPHYAKDNGYFTMYYTVYADGTLKLWTSANGKDELVGRTYNYIDSGDIGMLIEKLRENEIWNVGECSGEDKDCGAWINLQFFDENGNATYRCGGLNPRNSTFYAAADTVYGLADDSEVEEIKAESHNAIMDSLDKDAKAALEKTIENSAQNSYDNILCQIIGEAALFTEFDPFALKYTVYKDGTVKVSTGAIDDFDNKQERKSLVYTLAESDYEYIADTLETEIINSDTLPFREELEYQKFYYVLFDEEGRRKICYEATEGTELEYLIYKVSFMVPFEEVKEMQVDSIG